MPSEEQGKQTKKEVSQEEENSDESPGEGNQAGPEQMEDQDESDQMDEQRESETVDEPQQPAQDPPGSPKHQTKKSKVHDSPDRYEEADISEHKDADALAQEEIVKNSTPTTELEIALTKILERKQALIDRITGEITKMQQFVRKRKQTYKRKRKENGAPTRALSAYNMFIKE